MLRARLRLLLAAVVLVSLSLALSRRVGPVPALGALLDPANGVWALARVADPRGRDGSRMPELSDAVRIVFDDRGVPHIFAANELDAWRALGYVVARDRLFQLELTWRAGAGRLSELLGARTLDADREVRRLGLAWSADRAMARADTAAPAMRAFRAYAEGVNRWIQTMPAAAVPLEYRLLGKRPARWEPRYSAYLLARMGYTLAYWDPARQRIRAAALVGTEAADALFPVNSPIQEPIQPNGQMEPRFDFRPLPPPGEPARKAESVARMIGRAAIALGMDAPGDGDGIGSNNWVVGPQRTAAHRTLLAGDPHLELTLPSIWYEAHVVVPDSLDVAGVTLPGSPGITIGWNRDVAWSFTNTGGDVLDMYLETVDDSGRYRLDGSWKPLGMRREVYAGPDGKPLAEDTVYFTHRGPVLRTDRAWYSVRWTLHDIRPDRGDFLRLNAARTTGDWLDRWKRFDAPAQNGVVADRRGTIAIRSTGLYPIRPGNGRGDEVRSGDSSASDWTGFLPPERYPFSLLPTQGFLASANQQPVDPRVNPAYLGAQWPSPWRAMRINALLRADSAVTPDAMRRYQTDPGNARADVFVPALLASAAAVDRAGGSDDTLRVAARLLAEWDRRFTLENERAVLFEAAMDALAGGVWDELIPPDDSTVPRGNAAPSAAVLASLLRDSASIWWDDRRTPARETRDILLARSLRSGYLATVRQHGAPEAGGWKWEKIRLANIHHLLRLPSLSARRIPVQGGNGSLNPSSGTGTHGASWRMVVELGDSIAASAIYPGGQSGNPASRRYDDRIAKWARGELDPVLFPRTPDAIPAERVASALVLRPAR